ncbi:MAG: hypothetical protein N4A72_10815 [Bacteroidales bacterium]|jgi:hypothetical protein|nr:hypothetical protein [Bacteroidales bacterium]
MDIKYWILTGVVSVFFTLSMLFLRIWLNRVLRKFDNLTDSVNDLKASFMLQKHDSVAIREEIKRHDIRINNHADRIRELEILIK